jgi:undecaprenyl-diphosphatase
VDENALLIALNTWVGQHPGVLAWVRRASHELPQVLLAALLMACVVGDGAWRRAAWGCIAAMALAWACTRGLEWLWPQQRPFALGLTTAWVPHRADASFPSTHASVAFAFVACAWLLAPRRLAAWMLLPCAVAVAASRVALGLHFPRDVLGGALLGVLCGGVVAWILIAIEKRAAGALPMGDRAKKYL